MAARAHVGVDVHLISVLVEGWTGELVYADIALLTLFLVYLGHTLGLTQDVYAGIDTLAWFSYYSCMNYTFQATLVDYSDEGQGGDSQDHNDWAVVDPAYGLQYSFGLSTTQNDGICD